MKASLNHVFRTIWSDVLNTWIAVSEITRAKGKRSGSCVLNAAALADNDSETGNLARRNRLRLNSVFIALACCYGIGAQANPIGAQVASGTASFNQSGNLLTITNSNNAIINWQGFSIGSGETTRFIQPSSSSSVLNRVLGADPSVLLGTLTSNGRVFLINPAGILVGQGASINVPGFVASTLNLSDSNFLAGKLSFDATANAGSIQNNGTITTPEGGSVYLIAPQISNTGIITTPKGETILAAGNTVQIMDTGTPGVTVQVTGSNTTATNLGRIVADSGRIGMVGALVNNSGAISANSLVSKGGKVFLQATQSATLGAAGSIDASGTTGGTAEVLGNQVAVLGQINASGIKGGGTVLIGGDAHGANSNIQNAQDTFVGSNATIKANATQSGNGGKVVVWADGATQFNGNISAKGGALSGNGGWIETSGKQMLGFAGLVDTTAAHGLTGTLLLDPTDITISSALSTNTNGIQSAPPSPGSPTSGVYSDGLNTTSNLNVTTLQTALATSNVQVTTSSALSGTGNITVSAPISWASARSLTLTAVGGITIGSGDSITNTTTGSLVMTAAATGGISIGAPLSMPGGSISMTTGGTISQLSSVDTITALSLTTSSVGGTTLNGVNKVGTFNATNITGGNILLTDGSSPLTAVLHDAGASSLTTTGALTVSGSEAGGLTTSAAATTFGADTISGGNLSVTAAGNVAQTGALSVSGTTGIAAAGHTITLGNTGNALSGTVTAAGAGITLNNGSTALTAALTNTGASTLTTTGALTVTGSEAGTVTATGNGITLTNSLTTPLTVVLTDAGASSLTTGGALTVSGSETGGLTTSAAATTFGADTITAGNLSVTATGKVTQTGALTVSGTTGITASGSGVNGAITLNNTGNALTGAITASGTGITLIDTVTSPLTANLTDAGASSLTTKGALTLSGSSALGLTTSAAATAFGTGSGYTVTGSLLTTATGAVTQSGALTVSGTTGITATGYSIALGNTSNVLTGAVTAKGAGITLGDSVGTALTVALTDTGASSLTTAGALTVSGAEHGLTTSAAATTFGADTISGGNLSVTATGKVTQTGALVVSGTTGITASGAGVNGAITLGTAGNALTGAITASGTGITLIDTVTTALTANLTDLGASSLTTKGALTLNGSSAAGLTTSAAATVFGTGSGYTVTGNLLTTATGAVTQNGVLMVSGTTGITSTGVGVNGAVTLGNSSNVLTGAVTAKGTGITLVDSVGTPLTVALTDLGASSITTAGTLTVSGSEHGLTTLGATATTFGANTVTGNLLTTATGAVTQTGALVVSGTTGITATGAGVNGAITLGSNNALTGAVTASGTGITLNNGIKALTAILTDAGASNLKTTGALTVSGSSAAGLTTVGAATTFGIANSGYAVTGKLNTIATGAVGQSGALTVTDTTGIAAAGNTVTLGNSGNVLTGAVTAKGRGITLNNGSTALNAALVDTGASSLTTTGILTVRGGEAGLTTSAAATTFGADTVSGGNLSVTASGAVTQTGALTVTGTSLIDARNGGNAITLNMFNSLVGTVTAKGTGITLTNGGKSLTAVLADLGASSLMTGGALTVSGSEVGLTTFSSGTTTFGAGVDTVTGNLNTTAAGVLQTGALSVSGTSYINTTGTTGAGANITLTNAANQFTGEVIAVSDNAITLAANSVGLTAAVNSVTTTSLTSAGALNISSGVVGTSLTTKTTGGTTSTTTFGYYDGTNFVDTAATNVDSLSFQNPGTVSVGVNSIGKLTVTSTGAVAQYATTTQDALYVNGAMASSPNAGVVVNGVPSSVISCATGSICF